MKRFSLLLGALLLSACMITKSQPLPQSNHTLSFIALGDTPYGPPAKVYPRFRSLIKAINRHQPELVIHVGDTKGGGACSDEVLDDQRNFMNMVEAPLLYTPGDNEWTDCHRWSNGDPLDRLNYIRKTYFNVPSKSLGQNPVTVVHQGNKGYPENVRYNLKGIEFITAHIVGSNNNFQTEGDTGTAESKARTKAAIDWITEGFDSANDANAIILAVHADMFGKEFDKDRGQWSEQSGFMQFGSKLITLAAAYEKPVYLIYGDSHHHHVQKELFKAAPNLTTIEVYGHPNIQALEIQLDINRPEIFALNPVY